MSERGAGVTGVLVMAYGTPASYEAVAGFYTDVRRGRPPSQEQLADLERRYAAVGGTSQLAARTQEQVAGIQRALDVQSPGSFACRYGSKHAAPKIEDAVDQLTSLGVNGLVGIVLAPHYSSASVGEYVSRARARAGSAGLPAVFVEDWHDNPVLVELLGQRVRAAYSSLGATVDDDDAELLVTAHSLPLRVIESGDGYDARLRETGELVAKETGVSKWRVCWQSAGRTPEPWIGPDILEVISSLPSAGVRKAVVCPAGFTSDHLEVNYDIDIEAKALAESVGVRLARTASLNDDPRLCQSLAELVRDASEHLGD
ncbi:MAG: ferrochelatase [Acidimicrobiales bacterium]|jgi:ferrochelatase